MCVCAFFEGAVEAAADKRMLIPIFFVFFWGAELLKVMSWFIS